MIDGDDFTPEIAHSAGLIEARFPETSEEVEAVESILANSFDKLSSQEREEIVFEKHGLPLMKHDDPETIDGILEDLKRELDAIQPKEAYNEALAMNPGYVTSRRFRLLFLRCEDFRVKDSARLLVQHFQVKKEIFSHHQDSSILGREVSFSDLSVEDQTYLRDGVIQIMEKRDVGGRTIMCTSPGSIARDLTYENMNEIVWYTTMACLREDETSRKGMVILVFNYNSVDENFEVSERGNRVRSAMPVRIVASHYCFSNPALRQYLVGIRLYCSRLRFVLEPHFGDPKEIDFELQTFGIPMEACPMHTNQTWTVTKDHLKWLNKQIEAEQEVLNEEKSANDNGNTAERSILHLRQSDVLFGRTLDCREHPGNKRVQLWVKMYFDKYETANKLGKVEITENIFSMIHASGGRFLKQEVGQDQTWVEVDDTASLRKIAHFFRREREKIREEEQKKGNGTNGAVSVDGVSVSRKRPSEVSCNIVLESSEADA